MEHTTRLIAIFRLRHFLVIWRMSISQAHEQEPDLFQLQTSFMAESSYQIALRFCDQFILLVLAHLEHYPGIPLMPWQHGTDFLEHFFGIARSFIPDFTYSQLLEMYSHIEARQRILATGKHQTSREKDSNNGYCFDSFIHQLSASDIARLTSISSRREIDEACNIGWHEAAAIAQQYCGLAVPTLPLKPSSGVTLTPSDPSSTNGLSSSDLVQEESIESEPFALEPEEPMDNGSHLTPSAAIAFTAQKVSEQAMLEGVKTEV